MPPQDVDGDKDADSLAATDVPQRGSLDIKHLALGRVDGFILSQIDGRSSLEDLASLVGLSFAEVKEAVLRLRDLGAVRLPGRAPSRKSKAPPGMRRTRPPPSRRTRPPPASTRVGGRSEKKASLPNLPLDCVPQLTGKSHKTLEIAMRDAFVLAQIDGTTPVAELAAIAGAEIEALVVILRRLEAAGAIDLEARAPKEERFTSTRGVPVSVDVFSTPRARREGAAQAAKAASALKERAAPASSDPPRAKERRRSSAANKQAAPVAPAPPPPPDRARPLSQSALRRPSVMRALAWVREPDDQTCELDAPLQTKITELHATLAKATHYELLGVPRDADRKLVKKAYFGFVATMHPDRHFRKKLGPFKQKLDDVFVRITVAFEALHDASARAAYDRTLPRLAGASPPAPAAVARAPAVPAVPAAPPGNAGATAKPVPAPAISSGEMEASPLSAARSGRARIRIATSRFSATYAPIRVSDDPGAASARPSVGASGISAAARPAAAPAPTRTLDGIQGVDPLDGLRRFFSGKVEEDSREHARVFVEAAEYELAKGNVIAAATHFQLALKACNAPEVRMAYEAIEAQAQERRFEMHEAAAQSAERDARWSAAADSYARAYAARPDAKIAERLANAIRQNAGDLREAAKLAEDAVRRDPRNAAYHVTLGEIYADAGLELRAQTASKKAVELAPTDARTVAFVERLAKLAAGGK
jgi:hypothetical protein